MLIFVLKTVC